MPVKVPLTLTPYASIHQLRFRTEMRRSNTFTSAHEYENRHIEDIRNKLHFSDATRYLDILNFEKACQGVTGSKEKNQPAITRMPAYVLLRFALSPLPPPKYLSHSLNQAIEVGRLPLAVGSRPVSAGARVARSLKTKRCLDGQQRTYFIAVRASVRTPDFLGVSGRCTQATQFRVYATDTKKTEEQNWKGKKKERKKERKAEIAYQMTARLLSKTVATFFVENHRNIDIYFPVACCSSGFLTFSGERHSL